MDFCVRLALDDTHAMCFVLVRIYGTMRSVLGMFESIQHQYIPSRLFDWNHRFSIRKTIAAVAVPLKTMVA